jgi:hypothetical protein
MTPPLPPTLSISTLVTRPAVEIDGERYALFHPDEFALLQRVTLLAQYRRATELLGAVEAVSPAQAQELHGILDAMVRSVFVDAPDAVHQKLRDDHRAQIAGAFTRLLHERARAVVGAQTTAPTDPMPPPTPTTHSGDPSPAANASMAAMPSAG